MGPIQPVLYSSLFSAPQDFCKGRLPVRLFEYVSGTDRCIAAPVVSKLFHGMDPASARSLLKNVVRFVNADVSSRSAGPVIASTRGVVVTPFRAPGLSDKKAVRNLELFNRAHAPRTTLDEVSDSTLGKLGIDFLVGDSFHVASDDNMNWLVRHLLLPDASGQESFEAILSREGTGEEINISVNDKTGESTFKVGDNLGERVMEYRITGDRVFQTSLSFIVPLLGALEFMGVAAPSNQQELDDFLKALARRVFLQQTRVSEQAVPPVTTDYDYEEIVGGNIAALPYTVVKSQHHGESGYPYTVSVKRVRNPVHDSLVDPELRGTEQLLKTVALDEALRFYALQITINRAFSIGGPVIELDSSLQELFPK